MRTTTQVVKCDWCGKLIDPPTPDRVATIPVGGTDGLRDICKPCIGALRDKVDAAYRRLFHNEVPDRRGGWRQLGEYDG